MVFRTVGDLAERGVYLQTLEGCDQLVGVGALGLGNTSRSRLDHAVAHHRAQARVVLELGLVRLLERLVCGGVDAVPGIAGHQPAVGGLVFQGVHVFGLARQHADHLDALEEAARVAFAHELRQVRAKQHVEDGVGLGIGQRLHDAAGVHPAQWRGLLGHKLHVGLGGLEQLLERRHGRLPVFVVGVDHGPALFLHLGGLGHQHGGLHVGAGAQAEGVLVAALPGHLVGQRLARQEEKLLLLGEVGHRQAGVRQEGARQHIDLLARHQLFGHANGVAGVGVVVARDQFDLLAIDAARSVDLIDRQLHAFLVGLQESRLCLVAVDLANLDHALGKHWGQGKGQCSRSRGTHEVSSHRHGETPEGWLERDRTGVRQDRCVLCARRAQRRPSTPLISEAVRPPTRGNGRPLSVTTTATTISLARGASATRASMASKWLRT